MANIKLADDITIRDVLSSLNDPEEYVRGVFHNMHEWKRTYGDANVTLGITGKGVYPHYAITAGGFWNLEIDHNSMVFSGRNHKPITFHLLGTDDISWSAAIMGYDSVRAVLGDLRAKRKSRF